MVSGRVPERSKKQKKPRKTPDGEQKRKNIAQSVQNYAKKCARVSKKCKKYEKVRRRLPPGSPQGPAGGKGGTLLGVGFYIHLLLKVVVLLSKTTLCENSGF